MAKTGLSQRIVPQRVQQRCPVPPELPVPNCDCGRPADVFQSRHPDTAARCFYTCSHFNVSNYFRMFFFFICITRLLIFCWNFVVQAHEWCFFFQWIDGADKFDPRYLLFDDWWRGRYPQEHFEWWVPPPPNPPSMTAKEKHLAIVR